MPEQWSSQWGKTRPSGRSWHLRGRPDKSRILDESQVGSGGLGRRERPEIAQLEEAASLAQVKNAERADEQRLAGREDQVVDVAQIAEQGPHRGRVGEVDGVAGRPGRELGQVMG
jgi:hypothetical protein